MVDSICQLGCMGIGFLPSFEYAAALTLDSCVAQIAENKNITEEYMRTEHANIE